MEVAASQARATDFDALVVPGGHGPDHLRHRDDVARFTRDFFTSRKLVAAIGHGGQVLIDAGVVEGRRVTSAPAIQRDLENAGSEWLDVEVVVDGNLITSRGATDIHSFIRVRKKEVGADSSSEAT